MAVLFDKHGVKYNVPHAIDVKEWIDSGDYSKEKPLGAKPNNKVKPTLKPNLLDKD